MALWDYDHRPTCTEMFLWWHSGPQHQRYKFMPLSPMLLHYMVQHFLAGLVESLNHSGGLGMSLSVKSRAHPSLRNISCVN